MIDVESLRHAKWKCMYDVVWITKYRKKILYGELRRYLGSTFHELALQRLESGD